MKVNYYTILENHGFTNYLKFDTIDFNQQENQNRVEELDIKDF
jgi:hypothetical protein